MPRRKTHSPLQVMMNGRLVGELSKEPDGAIRFQYDQTWLDWAPAFAISLSLPLRETAWTGAAVAAVFENLLPDNAAIRRKVAERTGAAGTDAWSLLAEIGRDCVGALQFLHADDEPLPSGAIEGEEVSAEDIEKILAGLARAPLGMDLEDDFRISVAGAQEKTALLRLDDRWLRPHGTTPTTHLLKPQLGEIPTASGIINMNASVDNEHYCLTLLEEFGLHVPTTWIETFGERRVLVVERFDRRWRSPTQILRLPQEDCCQAMGVPPTRKYQSEGGPGAVDILGLLRGSDEPLRDQVSFLKCLILFWMIGATDGHAKNFSITLRPGGRYGLAPIYDVLSAQPAFDRKEIRNNSFKLAMSAGDNRKYRILEIAGRHFIQTAKEAGLGTGIIRMTIHEILDLAGKASARALKRMPPDFDAETHQSIEKALARNLRLLEAGLEDL